MSNNALVGKRTLTLLKMHGTTKKKDEQMLRKWRKFRLSFTFGLYVTNRIKIIFV
jgi:hypothetical protein